MRIVYVSISTLICLMVFFCLNKVSAQAIKTNQRIDSLLTNLKTAKSDTSKLNIIYALAGEFIPANLEKATYYVHEGRALAKKLNDRIGIADGFMLLGTVNLNMGDYDESLKNSENALDLYAKILKLEPSKNNFKIQKNKAQVLNNMGLVFWNQSNYSQALKSNYEALAIRKEIKNIKGIATSYNNLGLVYDSQGNYAQARSYYLKSIDVKFKIGDVFGIGNTLNNLGLVCQETGDYPEALKYHFAAVKLFERIGKASNVANCYNNIGLVFENLENLTEALRYQFIALDIRKNLKEKDNIARTSMNIGNIYSEQGKFDVALNYYYSCLNTFNEIGDSTSIANIYGNIAVINGRQKDFSSSINNTTLALKIHEKQGNYPEIANSNLNLGMIYTKIKKYNIAANYLNKGLALAKKVGATHLIGDLYYYKTALDSTQGNFGDALINYKLYIEYRDSIFNDENITKTVKQQMQHEFDKKEIQEKSKQEIKDALAYKELERKKIERNGFAIGALLITAFSILIFRSYSQKRKANEIITIQKNEVEKQRNIVQSQNKDMLDSIEYAKRIQATILPPPRVVKKYLEDSFILYMPKDIVAGDFYWMESKLNNEELILFAACDCTGHGVPGALVSVVCSNALNRAVKEFELSQPSLILDKVTELVVEAFSKDETVNVHDGMDASLCALNTETGDLEWAGANNPLWILRGGELIEFKADKQPIGSYVNARSFTNHHIKTQKGDTMYLFTDGYSDQFGGELNRKFTKSGFKKLLLSIQHLPLADQRNELYEFHNSYRGSENEQIDDILIIGVRL